jgi:ABC-2 type transport system ATP-binding protein
VTVVDNIVPVPGDGAADKPSADDAVVIEHLSKRYGDLDAVRDLNLRIPRGSVFGVIGPNGAGKSTTFLVLASLLRPSGGRAAVAGFDTVRDTVEVRRRVGYMPDVMGVYDNLRVREYLEFYAAAYRLPRASFGPLIDGLLELVDLGTKADAMVDSLSRGMKQRLSLARALVHDPEVLILDEPASGLDPRARVDLRGLLGELRSMGKTVVISSHILAELAEMCTEVAIMEAGHLLAVGTPDAIRVQLGHGRSIRVTLAGGVVRTFTVADEEEQRRLLHRLVVEDAEPVVEFTVVDGGLEDLFMKITKGVVQ